jgi:membrane protein implicated in regulation of membrane protease activity
VSIIGTTGHVITTCKGADGPGEVELGNHGVYVAWSKERLPIGTTVLVVNTVGVRAVKVEPFDG